MKKAPRPTSATRRAEQRMKWKAWKIQMLMTQMKALLTTRFEEAAEAKTITIINKIINPLNPERV